MRIPLVIALTASVSPDPQEYFLTVQEFLKLEKVQLGGNKGQSLNEMVEHVFAQFQEQITKFSNSTYDPLGDGSSVGPCIDGN